MLESIPSTQSELMSAIVRHPLVVTPGTTAIEAIDALYRRQAPQSYSDDRSHLQAQEASCILIVDGDRLVGILTARDIVRLTVQRRDLENLTIGAVMTADLVTLRAADFTDVAAAIALLNCHQIDHLPVVDDRDGLVGLLTATSLQQHLTAALVAQVSELEAAQAELFENHTLDLEASEQFLQTVFDTFPLSVFWKDRQLRFLGCNENFARDANLTSVTQIVGKTDYDLPWGAIEGDAYRADDRQVIDSGIAKLGIIERQTRADGSAIWVETNKVPLRNRQGKTLGVLGTYQDITERKQSQTQLHQISERLSLSLKSGAIGCWEWDIAKDCLIWDERMYELYGRTRTCPSAECPEAYATWLASVHPDDRADTEDKLAQALLGQAEYDTEYRVIHPDGSIHFIKAYGVVQRDDRGQPYSTIGINFDISAAKREEANHRQTEQTIRQQAEREFVLREITQRIRKSLDLPTVFATAVREIRQVIETDRVGIFKFYLDSDFDEGEFVAESVGNGFESILGARIHDPGFGNQLARYYQKGRINIVEDIHAAELLDSEVRVLNQFQVRANLVVPLFQGTELWGLLCIHHCAAPRCWQEVEINLIEHIAEQIGIAIQQATLYAKVQSELAIRWQAEEAIALQLRQQRTLGAIAHQIRNSLKIEDILATATAQVRELMMVDRVTIFRVLPNLSIRAVEEVVMPDYLSLVATNWERAPFSKEELEFYLLGQPRPIVDINDDLWSLQIHQSVGMNEVKSKIVAPILLRTDNRTQRPRHPRQPQVRLWGLISVHACATQRHWQDAEAQLLQQIADQLAIAIQQAILFEQLQQELTERQQAETQLRQSNHQLAVSNQELARATRLKDEFLASMSHELRTPLNAILGMSEGLQDEAFGTLNDRQQKSLATISKSGTHLLALINDILDLSKIEANKFQLEIAEVSIATLCQNSLILVKELAHKKQIRLTTQLPESLKHIKIQVDDRRCRQVLINLLSNAVKFTPAGGSITLDVRLTERGLTPPAIDPTTPSPWQIVFSIIDTGIGIAPENIPKLFQSFVQIDSSLSRQYAGTGLGLALVKRIVEMHGGTVSVQSQVDRGSCFTVSLPFHPSAETAVPPAVPPLVYPLTTEPAPLAPPAVTLKASILVVEDNDANMETMTGYLESRGYRPIEASTGRMAIEIAQSQHPDVILMDIQMPDLDGYATIGQLRQIPECAKLPIVALTALAMPLDRQKCLDAGADRYMTKPVKLSQLVATIEQLIHST
ncbi:GAF domain-containing protein [Chamaesiphon sp. OTE_8_metabat_110]|uniref:GAF domain-containing protein n=1 Tax=Chamaesiphon sp. OTE_8_metabat_110 TaxID=2964696 RepID=UPI00286A652B|nr:GAF domain-containing protein [Chamaesiphon sp. OTE_8_metabat_110]